MKVKIKTSDNEFKQIWNIPSNIYDITDEVARNIFKQLLHYGAYYSCDDKENNIHFDIYASKNRGVIHLGKGEFNQYENTVRIDGTINNKYMRQVYIKEAGNDLNRIGLELYYEIEKQDGTKIGLFENGEYYYAYIEKLSKKELKSLNYSARRYRLTFDSTKSAEYNLKVLKCEQLRFDENTYKMIHEFIMNPIRIDLLHNLCNSILINAEVGVYLEEVLFNIMKSGIFKVDSIQKEISSHTDIAGYKIDEFEFWLYQVKVYNGEAQAIKKLARYKTSAICFKVNSD